MDNKIHEFDPAIYPCRLWVSINLSFQDVSDKFYALNDEMDRINIVKDQWEMSNFTVARTHVVTEKYGRHWIGVMVSINKPKMMTAKFIAHESCHCADFICEQFGISSRSFDDGEAYAYLVGWIAECIEKVKLGKV